MSIAPLLAHRILQNGHRRNQASYLQRNREEQKCLEIKQKPPYQELITEYDQRIIDKCELYRKAAYDYIRLKEDLK